MYFGQYQALSAVRRWGLLSHSQNAVRCLALSKRSVQAPLKHVSCMIHESWVLHAMQLSMLCNYPCCTHFTMHASHMLYATHVSCRNTCVSCTVYIEIFSVDTFLQISLVSLHSQIKKNTNVCLLCILVSKNAKLRAASFYRLLCMWKFQPTVQKFQQRR